MSLRRRINTLFLQRARMRPKVNYGCRMSSARQLDEGERAAMITKIDDLGPWFHNYELASDVWSNPSGRFPGVEYPLERWGLIEPLEQQPLAIQQAQFASRTLGLDAEFRSMSAYDLGTLPRIFDVVLFMGVFYHLRHPLVALEAVRAVCGGTMIFQSIPTPHERDFSGLQPTITGNVDLQSLGFSARANLSLERSRSRIIRTSSCNAHLSTDA